MLALDRIFSRLNKAFEGNGAGAASWASRAVNDPPGPLAGGGRSADGRLGKLAEPEVGGGRFRAEPPLPGPRVDPSGDPGTSSAQVDCPARSGPPHRQVVRRTPNSRPAPRGLPSPGSAGCKRSVAPPCRRRPRAPRAYSRGAPSSPGLWSRSANYGPGLAYFAVLGLSRWIRRLLYPRPQPRWSRLCGTQEESVAPGAEPRLSDSG